MERNVDFDRVATFVSVVDAGGISAASRRLGVPKSTVSRHVSALEETLGVRLLQRTSRRLVPTEEGQIYYDRVALAVRTLEDASASMGAYQDAPRGLLRVTAPMRLAQTLLPDIVVEFASRYPEVQVEVDASDRLVDLVAEGFDVALRAGGPLEDSSLVARVLQRSSLRLCASPAYLAARGVPREPCDLRGHAFVRFRERGASSQLTLQHATGAPETVEVSGPLIGTEFGFVEAAILAGAGVGPLPAWDLARHVAAGTLRELMPEWSLPGGVLYFVVPSGRLMPAKVRAFRDLVIERTR